jgi:hypothetical protein
VHRERYGEEGGRLCCLGTDYQVEKDRQGAAQPGSELNRAASRALPGVHGEPVGRRERPVVGKSQALFRESWQEHEGSEGTRLSEMGSEPSRHRGHHSVTLQAAESVNFKVMQKVFDWIKMSQEENTKT